MCCTVKVDVFVVVVVVEDNKDCGAVCDIQSAHRLQPLHFFCLSEHNYFSRRHPSDRPFEAAFIQWDNDGNEVNGQSTQHKWLPAQCFTC